MKKLIYYVATTLDGFIAHEDGSFDGFCFDEEIIADFIGSFENFDTVLMGRKTYEVGLKEGKTSPYPMMKQFVFSKTLETSPDENVELVSDNIIKLVAELKEENGKDIWLCGGGNLASQLLNENLIDKLIIKLNPIIFGKGIPLFDNSINQNAFKLADTKTYECGVSLLNYEILK